MFLDEEIAAAVKGMNKNSAPGPDGFGPSFYAAAWSAVKTQVVGMAAAFHSGRLELDRINRSYMVLLPKKSEAKLVSDFRPICLQNCSVKIISKMLTTRLQGVIGGLIDLDQTGFLKGRSIAENFVYAMELVQCCHKQKLATVVLKLDFAKAFDTVQWPALLDILSARGFSSRWVGWILHLLSSSKTAILVNGCPGPWFDCKRGLRQGDPISPYLFLLVADVLQRLIKVDSSIRHPVQTELPGAVLQYADDTLIVMRGDVVGVQKLAALLEQFSAATGLAINFSKSVLVPLHMEDADVLQCVTTLGCRREGFPQSYLGLPLSNTKLKLDAFTPLIAKADKYLAGWQAALLNPMGRLVLVNAVLDSQLIYHMSALLLAPGIIKKVDQRRRGFLWSGAGQTNGAKCLVAWDDVQKNRPGRSCKRCWAFSKMSISVMNQTFESAADNKLQSGMVYQVLRGGGAVTDEGAGFIWKCRAPPLVQFFGWLALRGRLQCRANLVVKGVVPDDVCVACRDEVETSTHILFQCRFAVQFWSLLHIGTPASSPRALLHLLRRPHDIPALHFNTFALLCCWNIWKKRNKIIFEGVPATMSQFLGSVRAEAALWRHRLKVEDRWVVDVWCSKLVLAN
ncbi:hypothetical protein U9M48_044428 [Paspalum notatum var. saurae]|uniref:Reverse transcriptase domain-containing protein n=1 Tax=Paspalum notatum var. saurae TaxID=547442 RepID=A0AAQ3UV97_PASNO